MSAYSDWKCGAITDDQYRASYNREQYEQDHPDEYDQTHTCEYCQYCKTAHVFPAKLSKALANVIEYEKEANKTIHLCAVDPDDMYQVNPWDCCDDWEVN